MPSVKDKVTQIVNTRRDESIPYQVKEAIDLAPVSRREQRQDSTTDQLITVLELARRAGCYDAYDLIKRRCMGCDW